LVVSIGKDKQISMNGKIFDENIGHIEIKV